ncbi:hypothetical protein B0H11DRAFT_2113173 [Mycena galericulata]|nr:hypothetical protein B0H11DRAFT_2113173 [Mycena galericulata]
MMITPRRSISPSKTSPTLFLFLEDLPNLDNLQDAIFERNNSNEFGSLFNADTDDPEVHEIHRQNLVAIRGHERDREDAQQENEVEDPFKTAPPRHRKVLVKLEPPGSLKIRLPPPAPVIEEEITIDDFQPPAPNAKKAAPEKKGRSRAKKAKTEQKPTQVCIMR